jgi:COP9 signalosome complex subunit 5
VVIDPLRTMMKSELDVGAFRTYPENYIPPPGFLNIKIF